MDDPWYLFTEEQNEEMTIQRGKENFSLQYTNSDDNNNNNHDNKHGCSCCAEVKPSEIDDDDYNILKSDVHWHNSEPVSTDIFEYFLTDEPDIYKDEAVTKPVNYCWHIDSPTGIESNGKSENNDDSDNKSESSSSSSDGCNSIESYAAATLPIDILTEAACGILKDVNYELIEDQARKNKKKEKTTKINPIFQGDPYIANHRMLINKRQNDRLDLLSDTFKYVNNKLPPYIKCDDVRDNTKLGILRRAIKYINILVEQLDEDDNNNNNT